jgi:hypothetical protein
MATTLARGITAAVAAALVAVGTWAARVGFTPASVPALSPMTVPLRVGVHVCTAPHTVRGRCTQDDTRMTDAAMNAASLVFGTPRASPAYRTPVTVAPTTTATSTPTSMPDPIAIPTR